MDLALDRRSFNPGVLATSTRGEGDAVPLFPRATGRGSGDELDDGRRRVGIRASIGHHPERRLNSPMPRRPRPRSVSAVAATGRR